MRGLSADTAFPIAVDGPGSSGKTTLGARLACELAVPFLDTGLLYRAVGAAMPTERADDAAAAAEIARRLRIEALDERRLATEAIGERASRVAAMPAVRAVLFDLQRDFALRPGGALLVGRDIGTAIVPEAPAKVFVTASVEVRAARRCEQLQRRGTDVIYSEVLAELRRRDQRDATRRAAPLQVAADAFVLDTTRMDFEAAVAAARGFIDERAARARG